MNVILDVLLAIGYMAAIVLVGLAFMGWVEHNILD